MNRQNVLRLARAVEMTPAADFAVMDPDQCIAAVAERNFRVTPWWKPWEKQPNGVGFLSKFLDISHNQATRIWSPPGDYYNASPDVAGGMLRDFADTGEVNWYRGKLRAERILAQ